MIDDLFLPAVVVMFIGLLVGLELAFRQSVQVEDKFMADCARDRKEYECVAMWHNVPVFVYR